MGDLAVILVEWRIGVQANFDHIEAFDGTNRFTRPGAERSAMFVNRAGFTQHQWGLRWADIGHPGHCRSC